MKYVKGDLLNAEVDVIAHGCNCIQTMGAGIARHIAQVYPEVEKADFEFTPKVPSQRLGKIDPVKVRHMEGCTIKYVVNCYTQLKVGEGLQVDYAAIEKAMQALHDFAKEKGFSVAIPKIGAGLGGGDWARIEKCLFRIFKDYDLGIYYLS